MTPRLVVDGEPADGLLRQATDDLTERLHENGAGPGSGVEVECADPVLMLAIVEATARLEAPILLRQPYPWPGGAGPYEVRVRVTGTARSPVVDGLSRRPGARPFPAGSRVVMWTSGSSGEPKAVLLDRGAIEHQRSATCSRLEYEPQDRIALPLPVHHAYGFGVVQAWWHCGATLLLNTGFRYADIVADLVDRRATTLDSVPSLYSALARSARNDRHLRAALAALRLRGCGGDRLGTEVAELYEEGLGAPLHDGYGLTEAGPNVALSARGVLRRGTVGTAIDGVELRLDRTNSEIQVQSPSLMTEYCGDPEATSVAFTADGWLRTGDLGTLDDDGYLSVVQRLKDCLIVHGETVPPAVIERVLRESDSLQDSVVIGVPSGSPRGDTIVAYIRRGDMAGMDSVIGDELVRRCRDRLPSHLRPRVFEFVDDWPRLPSGKVDRHALRASARDDEQLAAGRPRRAPSTYGTPSSSTTRR